MWFYASYLAWAVSAVLAAWMILDWIRTDSSTPEDVLTSSREGEIEMQTEQHRVGEP